MTASRGFVNTQSSLMTRSADRVKRTTRSSVRLGHVTKSIALEFCCIVRSQPIRNVATCALSRETFGHARRVLHACEAASTVTLGGRARSRRLYRLLRHGCLSKAGKMWHLLPALATSEVAGKGAPRAQPGVSCAVSAGVVALSVQTGSGRKHARTHCRGALACRCRGELGACRRPS
jgi:hypothetical protein